MKIERKSNFDLLKIIAMFLIVLYHCYIHSGFKTDMSDMKFIEVLIQIICMFGVAGNVIFALISGYFLINSKEIKIKKVIQILLQVWFYSILILCVFIKLNIIPIENNAIIKNLMPLSFSTNWYATFYFLLYILSPYLNKLLKNLSKQQYKTLLLIMFVFFCVWGTLEDSLFLNSKFVYYIFVYCVGGYIGLYEKDITISKKKSAFFLMLSFIITILALCVAHVLKLRWNSIYDACIVRIFRSHPSIFQFLIGLFMFLLFKNINIKSNKVINTVSSCTLGIYLLHENYFVRKYIWTNIFKLNMFQDKASFVFLILGSCLIVFAVCVVIELIRKNTIEKFCMKIIESKEENIENFKNKLGNFLNKILISVGLEKSN